MGVCAVGVCGGNAAFRDPLPKLPTHLSGTFNDYTPPAPAITGGPYEMHGKWSLQLNEERRTATLVAEMSMETADFANTDPNHDPAKLGAHTHHLTVNGRRNP